MIQYIFLLAGMISGFIAGYFFNHPVECPKIEECDRGIVDRAYDSAVKNCVKEEGWEDYECFRYIGTGRAPATPTPKPSPTTKPKASPSYWDMPKYKPYYEKDTDSEEE